MSEFKILCPFCMKSFTDSELWKHIRDIEEGKVDK